MKRNIALGLFVLCAIIPLSAQSNFKEGYVISNKNDTLFGLIDFRTDMTNSELCKFKKSETEPVKNYHPGEIEGYRFVNEGKYYVSRTVTIDSLKRTVFLEFLVQGLLNLYYFAEGDGYYFFENKNGEMVSVTKKTDEVIPNEVDYPNKKSHLIMKSDNRYKGILSYVFKDDLSLALETTNARFERKSMIEYTKEYHVKMCDSGEKCIIFENDYKKKFTKFDFSVYSGVELNTLDLKHDYFSKMQSCSPVIGVGVNVSSPRALKSMSLLFDVCLSKVAGACDYTSGYWGYYQYQWSGVKLNCSVGLEYIYDKGKIRPTINVGFLYGRLLDLKSTLKQENSTVVSENKILPLATITGIKGGIGFDYKLKGNHFIAVRVLYSDYSNYSDMNTSYQLKLGYKF